MSLTARDKRLVQSSRGAFLIDFTYRHWPARDGVNVTSFNADGSGDVEAIWSTNHEPSESLATFLRRTLDLPEAEAEVLASQILGPWSAEWVERGGDEANRRIERWVPPIMLGAIIVCALAAVGVVALVWLVFF